MEKNICIIGFGEMGKRHAKDMHDHSNGKVKIVAVYEPNAERYQQGIEWLGYAPNNFTSISKMLDSINPDGVIIASPNNTHWDVLEYFKGRTIPLIIEKPLDSTFDKLLKIMDFTEKYNAPIMVHHVMRYAPIVKKAKALIDDGVLGQLYSFRLQLNGNGGHMHNFRRNKTTGGGQLLEKATHDLDIMLHLMNSSPKRVVAICKQQAYGGDKSDDLRCCNCDEKNTCRMAVEVGKEKGDGIKDINISKDLCVYAKSANIPDNEICLIELENGAFGSHVNTFFINQYYSRVYEIVGANAIIRICFSDLSSDMKTLEKRYSGKLEIFPQYGKIQKFEFDYEDRIHYNGSPGVFEHFNDLMMGKVTKPYSPVDEAFAAEMIAVAAYKSSDNNEYVTIKDILPNDMKDSFNKIFKSVD